MICGTPPSLSHCDVILGDTGEHQNEGRWSFSSSTGSQKGVLSLLSGVLRRVRSATGPKYTTLRGLGSRRSRGRRPRSIKWRPRPRGLHPHRDDTAAERSIFFGGTPGTSFIRFLVAVFTPWVLCTVFSFLCALRDNSSSTSAQCDTITAGSSRDSALRCRRNGGRLAQRSGKSSERKRSIVQTKQKKV